MMSRRMSGCPLLVVVSCLSLTTPGVSAQAKGGKPEKLPKWKIDPYTKNDPELMKKAGYVSYGPFPFGDKHTSEDIDRTLSYEKLIWVETAHFRFGSSLAAWTVPEGEADTKKKIREELARLSERLPGINTKAKTLDPWLRVHLFAMRIEDIYKEFQELVGYNDADFPDPNNIVVGSKFMGYGRYLGERGKYLLFLTQKPSAYGEYLNKFIGKDYLIGQRWNFKDEADSLFFGTAAEIGDRRLTHDTAMHCHVAFNLAINLMDGYKHYSYDLPVWMREGFGHWFERRVNKQYNSYDQDEGSEADKRGLWDYEPEVRRLVMSGKFTPFAEMGKWRHYGDIKFNDHLCVWSRIDYLINFESTLKPDRKGDKAEPPREPKATPEPAASGPPASQPASRPGGGGPKTKFAEFLEILKSRVDPTTWHPDGSNLIEAQRDAMQKCFGLSARTFDERWKEWVIKTYSEK